MTHKLSSWIGGIIGGLVGLGITFTYGSWVFAGLAGIIYIPVLRLFSKSEFEPILFWLSSAILPIITGIIIGVIIGKVLAKKKKSD